MMCARIILTKSRCMCTTSLLCSVTAIATAVPSAAGVSACIRGTMHMASRQSTSSSSKSHMNRLAPSYLRVSKSTLCHRMHLQAAAHLCSAMACVLLMSCFCACCQSSLSLIYTHTFAHTAHMCPLMPSVCRQGHQGAARQVHNRHQVRHHL
jgi:hypothetical protein